MVAIEALDAKHGDCLLLHYAGTGGQRLWLIDGGPRGTWNRVLKHRLNELALERPADPTTEERTLPISLGVVTHIDSDHIAGMVELVAALSAEPRPAGTPAVVFGDFWFNGFRQILAGAADGHLAALTTGAARLAAGEAFLESVTEGTRLQGEVVKLRDRSGRHLVLNRHFPAGKAVTPFVGTIAGAQIALLGPTPAQLDELRDAWAKEMQISPAQLAASEARDTSATNRSSIAFLATVERKTILFTGDALAEDLVRAWTALEQRPSQIDLMKVPHHGAQGNNSRDLFTLIPARHYLFCANGRDGNPDVETLDMLFDARPDGGYAIHLTASQNDPDMARQVAVLNERAPGAVTFRGDDDRLIRVDL